MQSAAAAPLAHARTGGLVTVTRLAVFTALLFAALGTYGERWGLSGLDTGAATSMARVGEMAPPFTARTLDGTTVSLQDVRGRVVVLNFWATWCGPCRVEMPDLARYQAEAGDRVAILGVNMQEPPSVIVPFVRQYDVTLPILLDENSAIAAPYRVTGLPTSIILDRAGVIRGRVVGPMTRDALAGRVKQLS